LSEYGARLKIPMLLIEAWRIGVKYMLLRLAINIPGDIIMAFLVAGLPLKNSGSAINNIECDKATVLINFILTIFHHPPRNNARLVIYIINIAILYT